MIHLRDGRWLVARVRPEHRGAGASFFLFLVLLALAVGIGAYPVVRRLTRRLERLQAGVEALGAGNLSARVRVEGRDEVAQLAESFNRAAGRIEALMGAHKTLLANASHELRTPLTRIRMAVELLKGGADPERRRDLERDIAELDALIDEILLASRLDVVQDREADEDVDLLALASEECARYEHATLEGRPAHRPYPMGSALEMKWGRWGAERGTPLVHRQENSPWGAKLAVHKTFPSLPVPWVVVISGPIVIPLRPVRVRGAIGLNRGAVPTGISMVSSPLWILCGTPRTRFPHRTLPPRHDAAVDDATPLPGEVLDWAPADGAPRLQLRRAILVPGAMTQAIKSTRHLVCSFPMARTPTRDPYLHLHQNVDVQGRKYIRGRWMLNIRGWPDWLTDTCYTGPIPPPPGKRAYGPHVRKWARQHLRLLDKHGKMVINLRLSLGLTKDGKRGLGCREYKMVMDWRKLVGLDPKPPVKVQSPALGRLFQGLR